MSRIAKRRNIIFFLVLVLSILLISCKKISFEDDIIVLAAASLSDPLSEISEKYQVSNVYFDFAGSYTLSNKIRMGSNADIVIFAGIDPLEDLVKEKYIKENSVSILLKNQLTLICSKKIQCPETKNVFENRSFKIAVADPKLAPLGKYSKFFLEENELWERVEKQLVYNLDAQATIASVESGNVPLGIVYSSDALTSDLVEVILDLEFKSLKVEYPVAIIDRTKNEEKALKFLRYLQSNESSEIFSKFGFSSLE